MTDSLSLVTAQISFLDPQLSLIHIPTSLYSLFIQPIFQLLFSDSHDVAAVKIPWTNRHDFLNITITSVEVSIICAKRLADLYFLPILRQYEHFLGKPSDKSSEAGDILETAAEDYIVIQVDGQGLDAGQRVLELTSPLAMAGISIFFLSTYFSDYILVPAHARRTVTTALEQRGFVFSKAADAFVSQLSPASPSLSHHPSHPSRSNVSPPGSAGSMPSTPPAKDIPELQTRTFTKLKKNSITPLVNRGIRLINCAGNRDLDPANEEMLRNDLMQVLLATTSISLNAAKSSTTAPQSSISVTAAHSSVALRANKATPPKKRTTAPKSLPIPSVPAITPSKTEPGPDYSTTFLSLTITSTEPISIFLEQRLLHLTRQTTPDAEIEEVGLFSSLLGAKSDEDVLVPITLDLRTMPMDMSGIVCGVAGRLASGSGSGAESKLDVHSPHSGGAASKQREGNQNEKTGTGIDVTFLSTAKAGTVLVRADQVDQAIEALEGGMREVNAWDGA